MKRIFHITLGLLLSMVGCTAQNKGYQSLDIEQFVKAIHENPTVLLDVRTAEEYAEGHLVDAINIDVQGASFMETATSSLPKNQTIAVYCRSGRRSKKAAEMLTTQGYKVIELSCGYTGWSEAGKPSTKEEVDLFLTDNGTCIYSYCIKHGSVCIRLAEKWIYVDPVTDKVAPVTDYTTRPKADIILITHEHADHLDAKAIAQLSKENTLIIANPNSHALLDNKGDVMSNGDNKDIQGLKIEAVPAYNSSPDKQQFHPKGRDNGYIISFEGKRIYLAGDTEDIPEMNQVKDIDIAFLPCNLPFTMTPEQLANAARMVQPKVLFPYHYGKTDIQQVVKLLKDTQIDVRIRQYQ